MKHSILSMVASAAIGAAAALYFARNPSPPARSTPRLDAATFQLAMIRALESVGFGAQARSTGSVQGGPSMQEEKPPTEFSPLRRTGVAPGEQSSGQALPSKNLRALESVRPFADDEQLRRSWLFRSERDVIAWLGTPDEVMYEAGGERWRYRRPDESWLVAFFARGRLLSFMTE